MPPAWSSGLSIDGRIILARPRLLARSKALLVTLPGDKEVTFLREHYQDTE